MQSPEIARRPRKIGGEQRPRQSGVQRTNTHTHMHLCMPRYTADTLRHALVLIERGVVYDEQGERGGKRGDVGVCAGLRCGAIFGSARRWCAVAVVSVTGLIELR